MGEPRHAVLGALRHAMLGALRHAMLGARRDLRGGSYVRRQLVELFSCRLRSGGWRYEGTLVFSFMITLRRYLRQFYTYRAVELGGVSRNILCRSRASVRSCDAGTVYIGSCFLRVFLEN